MSTIVGVDPGGTTGIAMWNPIDGLEMQEIKGAHHAVDFLADAALYGYQRMHHVTFVVERYTITPQTAKLSQQHDALEIIGAIKYLARKYQHEVVLQTPAKAKKFGTDYKLKALGWYQPGRGHARDASRHVLVYLMEKGIITPEDLV